MPRYNGPDNQPPTTPNPQAGSYLYPAPTPPRKSRKGLWITLGMVGIGLILLLCGLGMAAGSKSSGSDEPIRIAAPTATSASSGMDASHGSAPVNTKGTKAPAAEIHEGTWHVGRDVPAGTYRVNKAISEDDFCYWEKNKDAEGQDIISNANVTGGRPQVSLKKGQWFTTMGCGTWTKQ